MKNFRQKRQNDFLYSKLVAIMNTNLYIGERPNKNREDIVT